MYVSLPRVYALSWYNTCHGLRLACLATHGSMKSTQRFDDLKQKELLLTVKHTTTKLGF